VNAPRDCYARAGLGCVVGLKAGLPPVSQAKRQVLELVAQGHSIPAACQAVGRTRKAYENWRSADPGFAAEVDRVRNARKRAVDEGSVVRPEGEFPGFEDFRSKYLGLPTYRHQRAWIDLLEGRVPEVYHPAIQYEAGQGNRLLINTPPNHAKSMTVTVDYVTYRVARDPNIRIIIVSKTQKMAQQFLYAIKSRMTHPKYLDFQLAFGPPDGWKQTADQWTASQIYVGGEVRDSGEKDPTVQALGIGGQIYGARADLVIMDDCVVLGNSAEWEKQMTWLNIEVASRLGPGGKLLVIGTRVAPIDLYQQLRNPDHYVSGKSPWTYFSQPAVLSYGDGEPENWETLWPKASVPFEGSEDETPDENGDYRRWDGPHLANVRDSVTPRIWSMVYQQQDVAEDAIFHPIAVRGSVNGMRTAGPLSAGSAGHPLRPEGFYVVCGMDLAAARDTAAIAMAIDPQAGRRYVLDAHRFEGATPGKIHDLFKTWTDLYRPAEWVVESNAFQLYVVHDEVLNEYARVRGSKITPHYTSRINKWDDDFGVQSLATLFGSVSYAEDKTRSPRHKGDNVIELPRVEGKPGMKELVEQLVSWQPKTKNKTDLVMALWFCETAARKVIGSVTATDWFTRNPFASPRDMERRMVVNLSEWRDSRNVVNI